MGGGSRVTPKLSQGTYCRQDPPLGGRRGAGSVPRGSGARPAGRSSRHGAGSTCSEKESLAAGEMQPWLLSNPPTTGSASRALHPFLHQAPRSCSRMLSSPILLFPCPTPSLFSASLCHLALRAFVHPGFGTTPAPPLPSQQFQLLVSASPGLKEEVSTASLPQKPAVAVPVH